MRNGRVGAWVPAALFLSTTCAFAEQPGADDDLVELDPVVVTATRFETRLDLVPASIRIADASAIEKSAATNLADLLGEVGVLLRSYTGNPAQSQVDIRGFGESGNQSVLILVDGRRINAPDMSAVNWLSLPLAGVERVEVLRGAQSALYGNGAAGGVIKVETAVPEAPGGAALTGVGSWSSSFVRAAAWSPVCDGVNALVETGYLENGGYRDNSAYRTKVANFKLQDRRGAFRWSLSGGYEDNYYEFPGPLGTTDYRNNPRKCGYAPYESLYNGTSDTSWAGASGEWRGDSLLMLADLNASRRNLAWDMGYGSGAESTLDTWTASPRVKLNLGGGWNAILGADGEYDRMLLTRFADEAHTDAIGSARLLRTTAGFYGNLAWDGGKELPLSLEATARLQKDRLHATSTDEYNSDQSFDETGCDGDSAFSLGATYRPRKYLRLWTRLDRYYRYPAIDEVAAYQGYILTEPFNRDLRSERGWGGEVGADYALGPATLRVNAWVQDVDGLIAFDYMRNLNVNLADAIRSGVETGVELPLGDWRFGFFHSFTRVKFTSGVYEDKEQYLIPKNQLSGSLEWNPGRFSVKIDARYVQGSWQGNDFANTMPKVPGYFVMDVALRYRIGTRWHLFLAADNVLNRHYASLRYSGVWYPANALSLRGGVQWRY